MKPKIAELERLVEGARDDGTGCVELSVFTVIDEGIPPLLRLARAAKAMSMCATLHFGEDRELMFDLDAAIDAFDWSDS